MIYAGRVHLKYNVDIVSREFDLGRDEPLLHLPCDGGVAVDANRRPRLRVANCGGRDMVVRSAAAGPRARADGMLHWVAIGGSHAVSIGDRSHTCRLFYDSFLWEWAGVDATRRFASHGLDHCRSSLGRMRNQHIGCGS